MATTREQILAHLNNHQQSSVPELSVLFQVTRENIRYHLAALMREGQVARKKSVGTSARGHPTYLYSLTPLARPENYLGLARALLKVTTSSAFQSLDADFLANEIFQSANTLKSSTRKLAELVKRLNQLGYQAHWEAYSQGPRVIFRNCPYASLASDYPILCQADLRILEQFLDASFRQTSKTSLAGGSARQCIFNALST
jgi:predicted ArsR family transcriptional regulator